MQVTRPISILRQLVPFKLDVCGPVTDVTRTVFANHPHVFPSMLRSLEQLDTAAEPRIFFAEALHKLADESVRQSAVRDAFEVAEVKARQEFFQAYYDSKRAEFDFNYRLDSLQLVGAVGFWSRMMRISASPVGDALGQLTHLYTADARRDGVMKGFVEYITHQKERDDIRCNKHKQRFLENCLILERDIFGPFRLDRFSNRQFIFHCIDLDEAGKSEESYGMFTDIEAFKTHANFIITDALDSGTKWRNIEIRCGPEEPESPPYTTSIFNETLGRSVEVKFDEPLVGRPDTVDKRIKIENTIFPKTTFATFQLAHIEEDESLMGKLWRKRYDATREYRPELWK